MRGEYIELDCPFCEKGKIQCWYIPSTTTIKVRPTATFGKTKERYKSQDVWLIQSGCNVCKKNPEEIEKELKKNGTI
jgi:hypothetical protein